MGSWVSRSENENEASASSAHAADSSGQDQRPSRSRSSSADSLGAAHERHRQRRAENAEAVDEAELDRLVAETAATQRVTKSGAKMRAAGLRFGAVVPGHKANGAPRKFKDAAESAQEHARRHGHEAVGVVVVNLSAIDGLQAAATRHVLAQQHAFEEVVALSPFVLQMKKVMRQLRGKFRRVVEASGAGLVLIELLPPPKPGAKGLRVVGWLAKATGINAEQLGKLGHKQFGLELARSVELKKLGGGFLAPAAAAVGLRLKQNHSSAFLVDVASGGVACVRVAQPHELEAGANVQVTGCYGFNCTKSAQRFRLSLLDAVAGDLHPESLSGLVKRLTSSCRVSPWTFPRTAFDRRRLVARRLRQTPTEGWVPVCMLVKAIVAQGATVNMQHGALNLEAHGQHGRVYATVRLCAGGVSLKLLPPRLRSTHKKAAVPPTTAGAGAAPPATRARRLRLGERRRPVHWRKRKVPSGAALLAAGDVGGVEGGTESAAVAAVVHLDVDTNDSAPVLSALVMGGADGSAESAAGTAAAGSMELDTNDSAPVLPALVMGGADGSAESAAGTAAAGSTELDTNDSAPVLSALVMGGVEGGTESAAVAASPQPLLSAQEQKAGTARAQERLSERGARIEARYGGMDVPQVYFTERRRVAGEGARFNHLSDSALVASLALINEELAPGASRDEILCAVQAAQQVARQELVQVARALALRKRVIQARLLSARVAVAGLRRNIFEIVRQISTTRRAAASGDADVRDPQQVLLASLAEIADKWRGCRIIGASPAMDEEVVGRESQLRLVSNEVCGVSQIASETRDALLDFVDASSSTEVLFFLFPPLWIAPGLLQRETTRVAVDIALTNASIGFEKNLRGLVKALTGAAPMRTHLATLRRAAAGGGDNDEGEADDGDDGADDDADDDGDEAADAPQQEAPQPQQQEQEQQQQAPQQQAPQQQQQQQQPVRARPAKKHVFNGTRVLARFITRVMARASARLKRDAVVLPLVDGLEDKMAAFFADASDFGAPADATVGECHARLRAHFSIARARHNFNRVYELENEVLMDLSVSEENEFFLQSPELVAPIALELEFSESAAFEVFPRAVGARASDDGGGSRRLATRGAAQREAHSAASGGAGLLVVANISASASVAGRIWDAFESATSLLAQLDRTEANDDNDEASTPLTFKALNVSVDKLVGSARSVVTGKVVASGWPRGDIFSPDFPGDIAWLDGSRMGRDGVSSLVWENQKRLFKAQAKQVGLARARERFLEMCVGLVSEQHRPTDQDELELVQRTGAARLAADFERRVAEFAEFAESAVVTGTRAFISGYGTHATAPLQLLGLDGSPLSFARPESAEHEMRLAAGAILRPRDDPAGGRGGPQRFKPRLVMFSEPLEIIFSQHADVGLGTVSFALESVAHHRQASAAELAAGCHVTRTGKLLGVVARAHLALHERRRPGFKDTIKRGGLRSEAWARAPESRGGGSASAPSIISLEEAQMPPVPDDIWQSWPDLMSHLGAWAEAFLTRSVAAMGDASDTTRTSRWRARQRRLEHLLIAEFERRNRVRSASHGLVAQPEKVSKYVNQVPLLGRQREQHAQRLAHFGVDPEQGVFGLGKLRCCDVGVRELLTGYDMLSGVYSTFGAGLVAKLERQFSRSARRFQGRQTLAASTGAAAELGRRAAFLRREVRRNMTKAYVTFARFETRRVDSICLADLSAKGVSTGLGSNLNRTMAVCSHERLRDILCRASTSLSAASDTRIDMWANEKNTTKSCHSCGHGVPNIGASKLVLCPFCDSTDGQGRDFGAARSLTVLVLYELLHGELDEAQYAALVADTKADLYARVREGVRGHLLANA